MTRHGHSAGIILLSTLWPCKGWPSAGMNSEFTPELLVVCRQQL
jgi:hypothetical protein